jgi:iron complex outermembrane receptor protein
MKKPQGFRIATIAGAIISLGLSSVTLADSQTELEEVLVLSKKQPYRGDTPIQDLPQQVQVIDGDLIASVGAETLQGALDFAGGLARQNSFGGLWDSFAIRGFAGDENLPSGYLINGFSGGRGFSGNRDSANIDSIEILKGPGSALYGRGEPGGVVNIITKKPQFESEGYVRASIGRYNNYRTEVDYTSGLSESVAFRINGAYEDKDSFRDTVTSKKLSLTPSVTFVVSDSTSMTYELEYLDQETPFDRGIVSIDGNPKVLPVETFLGEPGDGPIQIDAVGHQLTFQHSLNDSWDVLGGIGVRSSSFEGASSEPELSGGRQLLDDDGETLVRQVRVRDYDADDTSARIEFTGKIESGALVHHMLIGADTYQYELDSKQDRWRVAWGAGDTTYAINVFDVVYGQVAPGAFSITNTLEEQSAWGMYIQDQIDLSDQWRMVLGLRYDDFTQDITNRNAGTKSSQDQTQTSPRFGLVYEPNANLSFYLSYANGFRPNSGADFSGSAFEPEESKSYEIGMKYVSDSGDLATTVALFSMEKSNILSADPVNGGFSAALGEAESEGLELDVTGRLSDSVRMLLTYAYVDAQTSNDVTNFDWGVAVPAGSPLINIPKHSANLLIAKEFNVNGADSEVGFTINYVDDRLGETIDPTYRLPEYTLFNLFGSYTVSDRFKVSVNLDNITDEKYYVSSYHKWWTTPGAPMTYSVGAEYKF